MSQPTINQLKQYVNNHHLDVYEITVQDIDWDSFFDDPDDPDNYIDESGVGSDVYLRLVDSDTDRTLTFGDQQTIINYITKQMQKEG